MSKILNKSRRVIHQERSLYQEIVLRQDRGGLLLTLNGSPQVHSNEESEYHECIATIPLLLSRSARDVLILGGGDGLAARNLLDFTPAPACTLVELDAGIISLCATHPQWRGLTKGSLTDRRLRVIIGDAIAWLLRTRKTFDVIIHDLEMSFTDQPDELTVARCQAFFMATYAKLRRGGIWVLTVPDDTDEGLPDGLFAALSSQLPGSVRKKYSAARGVLSKTRLLLEALFPHVRDLTIAPPVLGRHTTFYISNAPFLGFRRHPPEKLNLRNAERRLLSPRDPRD